MIGIVFATHREAHPLLTRSGATPIANRPFPLYRFRFGGATTGLVTVSGMGKTAAAIAGSYLVLERRVRVLISAGLCGRLIPDQSWSVGDIFRIDCAVEGDCDRFGQAEASFTCDPQWFKRLPAARLVTCDQPVFDVDRRRRLAEFGDLADMEGAAVARVAGYLGRSCAMVKGISDIADERGRSSLTENIDRVSDSIAGALINELS